CLYGIIPTRISRVPASGWSRIVRPRDLLWLAFFGALIVTSSNNDTSQYVLLSLLALAQVVEPHIGWLNSTRGLVAWIILKVVLAYLLIGISGGVNSPYWVLLLLPVIPVATVAGAVATIAFAVLGGGAYLSFLLFVDFQRFEIGPAELEEMVLRIAF